MAYSEAAKVIAAGYQKGDGIVYLRGPYWWFTLDIGVGYYLPSDVRPRDVFLLERAAKLGDIQSHECPSSDLCIGSEPRIWVVDSYYFDPNDPPMKLFSDDQKRALNAHYTRSTMERVPGINIILLQRIG